LPSWGEAQDLRAQVGVDRAASFEAMVAAAFPGAAVEWQGTLRIKFGDVRKATTASGFHQLQGWAFSAIEFPDDVSAVMEKIVQFKPIPPGTESTRLVVIKTADGHVVDTRVSLLDAEAALAQCDDIAVDGFGPDGWPLLRTTYSAMYVGSGWVGAIGWSVLIDTSSMTMLERFPVISWRESTAHAQTSDIFEVARLDDHTVEIKGGQRTFRYTCGTPCRVPVSAVLGE
jgi:hypothetical protein